MSAKQIIKKQLLQSADDCYQLSAEDKARFAEEAKLGMVAPNHAVLTKIATPVTQSDIKTAPVQKIIERLLNASQGQRLTARPPRGKKSRTLVGLAAPQIGESVRIIVVDTGIKLDRRRPGKLECFINPEIIWRSRETQEDREGCFSAGPVWGLVRRPIAVKMRALTPTGKPVERIFEGFTARIFQHEYDHLQGIRFADRIRSDKKRHWVYTEELASYARQCQHWPRLCTRERWEALKRGE